MPEHERDLPSLFLGKRQELRGALAHYVAVERYNVRDPEAVESRKQQQRILGRLAKCFRLFDQQTCPLREPPWFPARHSPLTCRSGFISAT